MLRIIILGFILLFFPYGGSIRAVGYCFVAVFELEGLACFIVQGCILYCLLDS